MNVVKLIFLLVVSVSLSVSSSEAQSNSKLISGPWAGNVELRNAMIWLEVDATVKSVSIRYSTEDKPSETNTANYKGELGRDFNPVKIELNGLKMNTHYSYVPVIDGKVGKTVNYFTTKDLWQWRKPAPDFSFLTGSCSYFNEPQFDRPGQPYGRDSSIFESMANSNAAFNLWLGDNWYLREVDFYTPWGIRYRASHDRRKQVLQKLFAKMPQYATWDDHEYGPNDANKSYELKEHSRQVFMDYWCNPSYGENGEGIYTKVTYSDVDLFIIDDRYFRSDRTIKDSVDGKANMEKTYFGRKQFDWLKNGLLYSDASFKIIVSGSQMLNPVATSDVFHMYPREYEELLDFLQTQKIKGVIFFSGDRHRSEVLQVKRKGMYTLYDVTVSPLTSSVSKARGKELNHPNRVAGTLVEQQNFGKVNITGVKDDRKLEVEFLDIKGSRVARWSVSQKELQ
jgi:alkaline phosphatase D